MTESILGESGAHAHPEPPASERAGILMVDDRPSNLLALEALLDGLGQDLVKALSGEEALRFLLRREFAVILLDVQMPGMSGFELADEIRRRPKLREVPIIFMTAVQKSEPQVARGYELGAVDYIFKPLVPEILRAKVSVFIELYRKSEQLRLQKERLAKAVEELRRSNEELGQFAYTAAHELKSPLRTVSAYLDLLRARAQGRLDPEAGGLVDAVVRGADRMQALIDALLAYAGVATREGPFRTVDSARVLDRVIEELRAAIAEAGARVSRDRLPPVRGDEEQLAQVLRNLLTNALKFRGERPPRVHVGVRQEGAQWLFSVADNGIGVEEKHAGKLFALFSRLHPRAQYPGSGIGLAVAKKVVERHGGRIWVESAPGKGATFFFTIPAGGSGHD